MELNPLESTILLIWLICRRAKFQIQDKINLCADYRRKNIETHFFSLKFQPIEHDISCSCFAPPKNSMSLIVQTLFLVRDLLNTHSCVSGGHRWCMFLSSVLRIVNKTSTWHNSPHLLPDIIHRIGVPDSCSISPACFFSIKGLMCV